MSDDTFANIGMEIDSLKKQAYAAIRRIASLKSELEVERARAEKAEEAARTWMLRHDEVNTWRNETYEKLQAAEARVAAQRRHLATLEGRYLQWKALCGEYAGRVAVLETALRRTMRCPSESATYPDRRCGDPGGCQGEPCEKCRLLAALSPAPPADGPRHHHDIPECWCGENHMDAPPAKNPCERGCPHGIGLCPHHLYATPPTCEQADLRGLLRRWERWASGVAHKVTVPYSLLCETSASLGKEAADV